MSIGFSYDDQALWKAITKVHQPYYILFKLMHMVPKYWEAFGEAEIALQCVV